jgi:hypothetical protein
MDAQCRSMRLDRDQSVRRAKSRTANELKDLGKGARSERRKLGSHEIINRGNVRKNSTSSSSHEARRRFRLRCVAMPPSGAGPSGRTSMNATHDLRASRATIEDVLIEDVVIETVDRAQSVASEKKATRVSAGDRAIGNRHRNVKDRRSDKSIRRPARNRLLRKSASLAPSQTLLNLPSDGGSLTGR